MKRECAAIVLAVSLAVQPKLRYVAPVLAVRTPYLLLGLSRQPHSITSVKTQHPVCAVARHFEQEGGSSITYNVIAAQHFLHSASLKNPGEQKL